MAIDWEALKAPFPPAEIEFRVGSTNADKNKGLALAYITSRHVMDRLDEVVGPENWQTSYFETPRGRVLCTIGINCGDDNWVHKSDGAGDSDVEAEKGAISDSMKRAAVHWGIGRYLYELGNIWVEIEAAGRSYRIKDSEKPKLMAFLTKSTPPPSQPLQEQKNVSPEKEAKRLGKNDEARSLFTSLKVFLGSATTLEELKLGWEQIQPDMKRLPLDWIPDIEALKNDKRKDLTDNGPMLADPKRPQASLDSLANEHGYRPQDYIKA